MHRVGVDPARCRGLAMLRDGELGVGGVWTRFPVADDDDAEARPFTGWPARSVPRRVDASAPGSTGRPCSHAANSAAALRVPVARLDLVGLRARRLRPPPAPARPASWPTRGSARFVRAAPEGAGASRARPRRRRAPELRPAARAAADPRRRHGADRLRRRRSRAPARRRRRGARPGRRRPLAGIGHDGPAARRLRPDEDGRRRATRSCCSGARATRRSPRTSGRSALGTIELGGACGIRPRVPSCADRADAGNRSLPMASGGHARGALADAASSCAACRLAARRRTKVVFCTGGTAAACSFVGEGRAARRTCTASRSSAAPAGCSSGSSSRSSG